MWFQKVLYYNVSSHACEMVTINGLFHVTELNERTQRIHLPPWLRDLEFLTYTYLTPTDGFAFGKPQKFKKT